MSGIQAVGLQSHSFKYLMDTTGFQLWFWNRIKYGLIRVLLGRVNVHWIGNKKCVLI